MAWWSESGPERPRAAVRAQVVLVLVADVVARTDQRPHLAVVALAGDHDLACVARALHPRVPAAPGHLLDDGGDAALFTVSRAAGVFRWRCSRTARGRPITGMPCLRGLRIPVATVVAMIAGGMTAAESVHDLPVDDGELKRIHQRTEERSVLRKHAGDGIDDPGVAATGAGPLRVQRGEVAHVRGHHAPAVRGRPGQHVVVGDADQVPILNYCGHIVAGFAQLSGDLAAEHLVEQQPRRAHRASRSC